MLTVTATVIVQVVAWPLVALLVRRAVIRRPRLVSIASAVLLVALALGAFDPRGDTNEFIGSANAVLWISAMTLLAVYPNGHFTPRWTIVPAALESGIQVANIATGFALDDQPWWPWHYGVTLLALLFGGQLYRFLRRSTVQERRQASWPLLAVIVQLVSFSLYTSVQLAMIGTISGDASVAASVLLNFLLGLGFAIGLLAPNLFAVDRALRAVILVSIVALSLLAVLALVTSILPRLGWSAQAVTWSTGIIVALLTVPLSWAARRVADLVVYRGRPDPLRTLTELGERLDRGVDPLVVPATVVRSVTEALGLAGAALRADGVLATELGTLSEGVERFPIAYQGEQLAVLEVSPRAGETSLTAHDRMVVEHLTRQAGSALAGTRAVSELIEARARVVLAREEERRRLRRDLHDDLAPTFAGLGLGAAAVQEFSLAGDGRAAQAAAHLVDGLKAATRQIREIAYDLRPPVLDDRGLVAAVRDRVEVSNASPVVRIDAPEPRLVLPAAVESAALRIVQEAVMNVRRHAAASSCTVRIRADENTLRLEIEDDGSGVPDIVREGLGLRSIRERASELAGESRVERMRGGGTRVVVSLPLREARATP